MGGALAPPFGRPRGPPERDRAGNGSAHPLRSVLHGPGSSAAAAAVLICAIPGLKGQSTKRSGTLFPPQAAESPIVPTLGSPYPPVWFHDEYRRHLHVEFTAA